MHFSLLFAFAAFRWLLLAACLYFLAVFLFMFTFMGNYTIDALFRPVCPDGWWHTSPFWSHCAFPPVSIAKYTIVYTASSAIALVLAFVLAPKFNKKLGSALLSVFALAPVVWVVTHGFSWIACASMVGVAAIAFLFFAWGKSRA